MIFDSFYQNILILGDYVLLVGFESGDEVLDIYRVDANIL